MAFETIESYELELAHRKRQEEDYVERRKTDMTNCGVHARKISDCERKLEDILSNLNKTMKSMESIAKGISNTVDSHRNELNSLTTRVKDVEHVAQEGKAQRQVMVLIFAPLFAVMAGVAFDYFNSKAKYMEQLESIGKNIKELHGKDHK